MTILKIAIAIILTINIIGTFYKAFENGNEELTSRDLRHMVLRIVSGLISAIILWVGIFTMGASLIAWIRIPVLVLLSFTILTLAFTAFAYITHKMR